MDKVGHLVVFARAPRIGRVKSRLAAEIGAINAWRVYRQMVLALLQRLGKQHRWHCWLAVDSCPGVHNRSIWPYGWRQIAQGNGNLGTRMASVARMLPPGPVVIIGSDIPEIAVNDVTTAFRSLARNDLVFGPAIDGGYWLIGFKRRPVPHGLFSDVRWSSRYALTDTLANARHLKVACLHLLEDIDTAASLLRWRRGIRIARVLPSETPPKGLPVRPARPRHQRRHARR